MDWRKDFVSLLLYKTDFYSHSSQSYTNYQSLISRPSPPSRMLSTTLPLILQAGSALASPMAKRQTCPSVHIFGARETTASPGYGSAGQLIDQIIASNAGATAEAIDYPASGSNPSYADSRTAGVAAVNSQVASFASQCPDTALVLVGYSQVRTDLLGHG